MEGMGAFIRASRQAMGLNQTRFAEVANIGRSHLAQIESGKITFPNAEYRRKIAKALGVSHIALLVAAGELTAGEIEQAGTRGVVADNPDDPRVQIHALVDQVNWFGRPDRIDGITSQLER